MTERSRLIEGLVLSGMAGLPITLLTDGSLSHVTPKKYGKLERLPGSDNGPQFEDRLACSEKLHLRMN
jgi:hypothetical protein